MGLRDDLAAAERHRANGTLKEWHEGTPMPKVKEEYPSDTSIGKEQFYSWYRERGD